MSWHKLFSGRIFCGNSSWNFYRWKLRMDFLWSFYKAKWVFGVLIEHFKFYLIGVSTGVYSGVSQCDCKTTFVHSTLRCSKNLYPIINMMTCMPLITFHYWILSKILWTFPRLFCLTLVIHWYSFRHQGQWSHALITFENVIF